MDAKRPNGCSTGWPSAFLTCPWQESPEGNESVLVQPCLIAYGRNRQAKWRAIEANHDLVFLAPSLGD